MPGRRIRQRGRRPLRRCVGAGVLALAGAVAVPVARGAPVRAPRPIWVLEAHVGERPADAAALLAPLLGELEARGFAVGPAAVTARLGGRAPRPGLLDPGRTAAEIAQLADTGFEAYTRGRFADAEAVLRRAITEVHRNPALLVLDTSNLNVTFKILVGLALSQAKRGDARASDETMAELIRAFGLQPIRRTDYGPEAEQRYRAVLRQVQAAARGSLTIAVDHEQAVIFVDGQIRGVGAAELRDLVPGRYRVYVQVPATPGRHYELDVAPNAHAELRVDWELDAALWIGDGWVGWRFATEADLRRLPELAARRARAWGDAAWVAVVGVARHDGALRAIGALYDARGGLVREGEVALATGAAPRLRALARFLDEGVADGGVAVIAPARRAVALAAEPEARARAGMPVAPPLLIGAGAAALVAGGVLYALDQDPATTPARVYRNTAPAAVAVSTAGLAALGMGVWLWTARGGRPSGPTLAIGHSGAVLGWTGDL
jgi:hypothetical protein